MTFRILSTILFLFSSFSLMGQNLSNKGKEFWVGYGHHQFFETGTNSQEMVLYLSAEQAATVNVSINGTAYSQTYSIPANTVIATPAMPKTLPNDCRLFTGAPGFTGANSEGVSTRGIRIISDVPIVAYAHIYGSASSGSTMLMPVETWGYSYVSLNSQQRYNANCFSWMYVVAKENNTTIEINPSVPTRGGKPAGVPFQVTLQKGQIYQLLGANLSGNQGYDLTGTTVKSIANSSGQCFPIGVFSGSSRTYITCSGTGGNGGDNLIQQVFPYQAWGKRYLTAPTSNGTTAASLMTNLYRVVVKDPLNTTVYRNGVQLTGLINNLYYEFSSGTADYIEADKPIMVAQYMPSNGGCPNVSTSTGDPDFMYISPIEQAINRTGFYRNTRESITINYLTLIIPDGGISSLTIDGTPVSNITDGSLYNYAHSNMPGYRVVVKRWPAAQAQCIVKSDQPFTAVTYGLGSVESYGYNAGTLINNLNVIGNVLNVSDTSSTVVSHPYTCKNSPVNLSLSIAYKPTRMVWALSQVPTISPNTDITIDNPVPVDSFQQNGTWYYKFELPGTFTFNTVGVFEIPVRNTYSEIENCNNTEEVKFSIEVKPSPMADFSFTHTGCVRDSIYLTSPVNSGNGYTIARWLWTYPGSNNAEGSPHTALLTDFGAQDIALRVISVEGCVGDTVKSVSTFAPPVTDFTTTPASVCEGSTVSFNQTSSYGGSAPVNGWYWNFGSGDVQASNGNAQTITFNTPGTYTIRHAVKVSNTCVSDTVEKVITVFAKPVISYTYPAGCLPVDGNVQFTNTSSVPDGQSISYTWNFGDNNATPSNPNTSTEISPSHIYALGNYTIRLTATTANGCVKDSVKNISFNVAPKLQFNALTSTCITATPLSIAQASVTNGVPGTGIYKGPGVTTAGQFTPATAGEGTHTIWYVFSSSGGCTDSVSQTIKVFPKPVADFIATPEICLNEQATIQDQSTISSGTITAWTWDMGDGNIIPATTGAAFEKAYTNWNNYNVKLTVTSDSGCISEAVTKPIKVTPVPKASFVLPAGVCMPSGSAAFTNQSAIADNAQLSYQWNFGDGLGSSTSRNPTYVYSASGSYTISLTVTSPEGCAHDTSMVLSAFYDQPVAQFTVSPDTLCQGTDNVFDNTSYAPNGTINSWTWTFGDGTTQTTENPVKKYNQAGNYTVTLVVKNTAGCTSEPFSQDVLVYLQPVIDAGPSFVVAEGTTITLNPTVNSSNVDFTWTPSAGFSDPNTLRPSIVATQNQTYTLTATGDGNCTATDTLTVKILRPVNIPNSFSPNGDGINDTWNIPNLGDYPGSSVEVYNRYGQVVFQSSGYGTPWNGNYKGSPLPFGTYYYIITLKNGFAPLTGSVTIVR